MDVIIEQGRELILQYGFRSLGSLAILVVGWWLVAQLTKLLRSNMSRTEMDATLASFLGNIVRWLLLALVMIAALANLGIPMTSIVAMLGAATLAIGLALQDSLGNLAAGVIIIVLRPYEVGNFVETNDVTGYVSEIQLFHTLLRTRDNKHVFVPNKNVLGANIINYSRDDLIRLDLVYGIGYQDNIQKAKQILEEIVLAEERVAQDPAPLVAVKALGESSVDLVAQPYVKVGDDVQVAFAITEQVKLRFDEAGISIPFPQRDLHLYQAN